MTGAAKPDGEATSWGIPLFVCELEGGSEALATQLVELPVEPGTDLLLVAEGSGEHGVPLVLVWGEPAFRGPGTELSLLDVEWASLLELPGEIAAWRASSGGELLLGGRPCDAALLMRSPAALRVRVPAGCESLVAECGFDAATLPGPLARARCCVYRETPA